MPARHCKARVFIVIVLYCTGTLLSTLKRQRPGIDVGVSGERKYGCQARVCVWWGRGKAEGERLEFPLSTRNEACCCFNKRRGRGEKGSQRKRHLTAFQFPVKTHKMRKTQRQMGGVLVCPSTVIG